MYLCVPGKSCYTTVGIFANGLFQSISHVQSGNVFQQEEVIVVKEPSGSSAPGLCPGLCEGWRSSVTVGTRVPRHGPWTGPGTSQLPSSSSPTGIEGFLKHSSEVHGLEIKKERCSKYVLFIYLLLWFLPLFLLAVLKGGSSPEKFLLCYM